MTSPPSSPWPWRLSAATSPSRSCASSRKIKADLGRQAKRDQLLDAQLQEASEWARLRGRDQAESVELEGQLKLTKSVVKSSGEWHF